MDELPPQAPLVNPRVVAIAMILFALLAIMMGVGR